jgi:hypothetical protein
MRKSMQEHSGKTELEKQVIAQRLMTKANVSKQ